MENRKLPNETTILILGIASILTCCCYGVLGLIIGIVALVLAKKDMDIYNANPGVFDEPRNINIGKILAIIGIVLSAIYLIFNIYLITVLGEKGIKEMQDNLIEKMKHQQENS